MQKNKWHYLRLGDVPELGTNPAEAYERRSSRSFKGNTDPMRFRKNPARSLFSIFIAQMKEILVLILIVAAVISALLRMGGSIVILIIVILNAAIGVFRRIKPKMPATP